MRQLFGVGNGLTVLSSQETGWHMQGRILLEPGGLDGMRDGQVGRLTGVYGTFQDWLVGAHHPTISLVVPRAHGSSLPDLSLIESTLPISAALEGKLPGSSPCLTWCSRRPHWPT